MLCLCLVSMFTSLMGCVYWLQQIKRWSQQAYIHHCMYQLHNQTSMTATWIQRQQIFSDIFLLRVVMIWCGDLRHHLLQSNFDLWDRSTIQCVVFTIFKALMHLTYILHEDNHFYTNEESWKFYNKRVHVCCFS